MTILIALTAGRKDDGALHLGSLLARSANQRVVVVCVVPAPWPPVPFGADKEYLTYQDGTANAALERAKIYLSDCPVGADYEVRQAPSVSAGLLEALDAHAAQCVVLGSSSAGAIGRVMLGSVAERILHSTGLPVAVAPRNYHEGTVPRLARVNVAFGRADHDGGLLVHAASTARDYDAPLRVVCFAVRPLTALVDPTGEHAERHVVGEWWTQLEDDVASILTSARRSPATSAVSAAVTTRVEMVLGEGGTWSDALHDVSWGAGELLIVGTSSGPMSRIFLGSHANKIVRNSPVPVMLLPRN